MTGTPPSDEPATPPVAAPPAPVSFTVPDSLAGQVDAAELGRVAGALRDTAGLTVAGQFVAHAMGAARAGAADPGPDDGFAALARKHGAAHASAMVTTARGVIAKAGERWPGVHAYLEANGLANDPHLIERLATLAARRAART